MTSRRIRPVTVVLDEEDEAESSSSSSSVQSQSSQVGVTATMVDRTMESFTQELDSMEQGPDLHEMIERAKSRAEQSYSYNNSNNNSSANANANAKTGRRGVSEAYQPQQQYATDPYAVDPYTSTSHPTAEDYRDTPDMHMRRTEGGTGRTPDSRGTIHMTTTTPQEPKPVRTPPYQRQSPLPAAVPAGYSPRFEGAGDDPERGRYESNSRRPSGSAQEVNSMQPPIPNGYSNRRYEGDADPERERRPSGRAQEVNSMQSPAAPNGYSTRRFEGDADPERERRTPGRAQEVNSIQSPTPNGYSTRRFEGAADSDRERRTPGRAQEVNSMQSPTPNGYSTRRYEGDADADRERRTYTRAEEMKPQMQSPAAPNGYSTRVFEGAAIVDPERENYENSSQRPTPSKRVEVNDRGGDSNNNQPPLSSVKLILDSMGNTMERQESRIRFLEEENEALRAELEYRKRDQRPVPTSTSRGSPHPEPAYSAPPPSSRPANSSTRSPVPVRESWEQNGNSVQPPTRGTPQPASSARSPMREPWEQQQHSAAPPSASRSASKQVRSPMPSSPYERSAPPSRSPGPEPRSFHISSEETRHSSPPVRSPRPEVWDHQTAPPMRSLGPVMYDPPREFTSPTTYRRPEEDVVHHHRTFSPGIKFVAELSNVMELEEGLHAPLSAVMDKYWDRINQVRNGHGWDR